MENNQQSFYQFSDQLRLQTNNLANLSLNDSIWSNSYVSKRPEQRRNFDISSVNSSNTLKAKASDFNGFNDGWKFGSSGIGSIGSSQNLNMVGLNGGFNKGVYSKPSMNFDLNNNNSLAFNNSVGFNGKGNKIGGGKFEDDHLGGKIGKKNKNKNTKNNNDSDNNSKNSVEKKFKTLPPSESLPRNETIGGYIFVCNNDTMQENLKRQLFGLPPRYRDSVRAITPGLPLFLYNYSNHQLHGVFEAASFGGTNIDPTAWEDKKNPGESRFPAQVQVMIRKVYEPLEEDSFRPILHHYDGPKFRLELSIPEALSLLDKFAEDLPLNDLV
ncbi:B2 protein-like [Cornus florida]|uniref:B2 protein-like n=1 Tax=Cornus florida TaxID=4283 RepID=UPI00289F93F9|nr:B2 protein-like [Cornus florida]